MAIEHKNIVIYEGEGFCHFWHDGRIHIAYSLKEAKEKIKWLCHSEDFHKNLMDQIKEDSNND